jgi:hypothetical protein
VTELCSGQALGDADNDAADTDAADTSNPYMSPFQGDTKTNGNKIKYKISTPNFSEEFQKQEHLS